MVVGDAVKWIGYPGASMAKGGKVPVSPYRGCVGIVVKIRSPRIGEPHLDRVDVSWSDGSFGKNLYPQTLEVISAS